MKAQLRKVVAAAVVVALVGLGFPAGTHVASADTSPSFGTVALTTPINEGQTAVVSGTFSAPDPDAYPLIGISWGNGMAPEWLSPADNTFEFSMLFKDEGKGSFTVKLTIDDGVNLPVDETRTLVVQNVAPSVSMTASATTLLDHDTLTVDGSFTDPGVLDTFTTRINWGDGSAATTQSYTAAAPKTFNASHLYPTPGSYTVTTTVTDNDGGVGTATSALTVNARNTPPSNVALTGDSVVAGTLATVQGTFADPDATDTHTVSVDWGDHSTSSVAVAAGVLSFSATHTYANAGTYTVAATVTDSALASASGSLSYVALKPNSAPADLALSTSSAVLGGSTTLSGSFSDADAADTHSVSIDWGDTSLQTLSLDALAYSFSTTHTYASAGSYTITVVVSDTAKATATATSTADVRSRTGDELIDDLTALIKSWGLDGGTENSLLTKVRPSCSNLSALANEVSAQTNKKLSMDQVNSFNGLVTQLSGQLGCSSTMAVTSRAKTAAK